MTWESIVLVFVVFGCVVNAFLDTPELIDKLRGASKSAPKRNGLGGR